MTAARLLVDTVFVQGLINRRDPHHALVLSFLEQMESAAEVWITEAVMLEVANALCAIDLQGVVDFIRGCYHTPNMRVVPLESQLLSQGLDLYEKRPDKEWSLTDCVSFVVMRGHRLSDALTTDRHFTQAGFRALLVGSP